MLRSRWNFGPVALAISLCMSVCPASLSRAGDIQLVECQSDGAGGSAMNCAPHQYGVRGDGSMGLCNHAGCNGACANGNCACRGGLFGHGCGNGCSNNGCNGGYVQGLFAAAACLGHGGCDGMGGCRNGCNGLLGCRNGCHNGLFGRLGNRCDACDSNGDGICDHCGNRGCRHCKGGHSGLCSLCGGGCYRPIDGYYQDPRDSEVYSAVGYNVPVSVPLAPVVRYQYQYGWGMPSSRLVQVGNRYTQYYPQPFFSQNGGRLPAGAPVIYHPTDTTQQGFYYAHAPRWTPVRNINSIRYNYGW